MAILLIGTLDTKGREFAYVRDILQKAGEETLTMDAGVLTDPFFKPDISRQEIYDAAGTSHNAMLAAQDRGQAIDAAARGVAKVIQQIHDDGKVQAVIGLGGSAGTTIATAAMRALPFGIPKVMVSTLASGQVKQYVGVRDILMLNSVVDISGLNRISRTVLQNAAHAVLGMVRNAVQQESSDKPLIAATMFGVTTPCVESARAILENRDLEVLVFHATGTGGQTMESFIRDGMIRGVLDITTTELADELVGGILSAGPERLTAAGKSAIPQVISVGALDMVNFGPRDTVPDKFQDRLFYQHNPSVTLMRTTADENQQLGQEIAAKANDALGPSAIILPLKGVSAIDREGQPFWNLDADAALFHAIRSNVNDRVELVEMDCHINDPEFAKTAVDLLMKLMSNYVD